MRGTGQKPGKKNRQKGVADLTEYLENQLKTLSIHTRDEAGQQLITRLEELLQNGKPAAAKGRFRAFTTVGANGFGSGLAPGTTPPATLKIWKKPGSRMPGLPPRTGRASKSGPCWTPFSRAYWVSRCFWQATSSGSCPVFCPGC